YNKEKQQYQEIIKDKEDLDRKYRICSLTTIRENEELQQQLKEEKNQKYSFEQDLIEERERANNLDSKLQEAKRKAETQTSSQQREIEKYRSYADTEKVKRVKEVQTLEQERRDVEAQLVTVIEERNKYQQQLRILNDERDWTLKEIEKARESQQITSKEALEVQKKYNEITSSEASLRRDMQKGTEKIDIQKEKFASKKKFINSFHSRTESTKQDLLNLADAISLNPDQTEFQSNTSAAQKNEALLIGIRSKAAQLIKAEKMLDDAAQENERLRQECANIRKEKDKLNGEMGRMEATAISNANQQATEQSAWMRAREALNQEMNELRQQLIRRTQSETEARERLEQERKIADSDLSEQQQRTAEAFQIASELRVFIEIKDNEIAHLQQLIEKLSLKAKEAGFDISHTPIKEIEFLGTDRQEEPQRLSPILHNRILI
ncbi:MAG: hypothetical protein EZS28_032209, partial [Streblomastix strix]